MRTIIVRGVNMPLLHDHLIANVPTFHRTYLGSNGDNIAAKDCGSLSQSGDEITISFSDDLSASTIQDAITVYQS